VNEEGLSLSSKCYSLLSLGTILRVLVVALMFGQGLNFIDQ